MGYRHPSALCQIR